MMEPISSFVAPLSIAKPLPLRSPSIPFNSPQVAQPLLFKRRITRCTVTNAVQSLPDLIHNDVSQGALRKAVDRIEKAVTHQQTQDTPILTYHHFHVVIHQAALKRQWEVAFRAFLALERTGHFCVRSTSTYLFDALTRAGRIAECDQILSQLWSHRVRSHDGRLVTLTESQVRLRRPDEKMIIQIANAAIHNGRPDLAVDMIGKMEKHGVFMSIFTVSVLIKAHGRQGNHEGITQVLASLKRRHLIPDLIAFNTAIDAYVRCGQRGSAFLILREINRRGLKPNARSFNPILKGLARSGKIDEMNSLRIEMEKSGVQASGYTFNAVVSAYVKRGEWDKANEALHSLEQLDGEKAGRNLAVAYTTIISGYAAEGKVSEALQLLNVMVNCGGPAFEEEVGVACTALLSAMMRRGEEVNAWKLFRSVRHRVEIRLPVDMYCAVIRGLAKRGNRVALEAAEKVFDEMMRLFEKDGGFREPVSIKKKSRSVVGEAKPKDIALAYNAIMDGYVRCGDTTSAERILDQMEDRAHIPTAITFTILINGYGKELDIVSAKRMFRRMRSSGIRPDRVAMNAFLGAHVRVGDIDTAVHLFEEMQRYAGPISPNLVTFSALIAGYVRKNMVTEAWDMYEEMKGVGIVPNERLLERMMAVFVSTDLKPNRGEVWELGELEDSLLLSHEPVKVKTDSVTVDVSRRDGAGEKVGTDEECPRQEEDCAERMGAGEIWPRQGSGFDHELEQLLGRDSGWASKRALVLMRDMCNCKCSDMNRKRWHHAIRSLWGP